eukprot:CAMPEP_0180206936 /NCGR_PEP_ID=MMETSP0987-20121128/9832_1 /TAXON_ID=697907 /ORGANISM="non described non described, Strain CCMP2293" /LENGTH=207 /DNA_ID=CAMNT_0022162769 /DNA_START=37 /DNA_END=661 /DNA_ORIENTATION=-
MSGSVHAWSESIPARASRSRRGCACGRATRRPGGEPGGLQRAAAAERRPSRGVEAQKSGLVHEHVKVLQFRRPEACDDGGDVAGVLPVDVVDVSGDETRRALARTLHRGRLREVVLQDQINEIRGGVCRKCEAAVQRVGVLSVEIVANKRRQRRVHRRREVGGVADLVEEGGGWFAEERGEEVALSSGAARGARCVWSSASVMDVSS